MLTVGAFEAKTRLSELLKRVEEGETVEITLRGRPIARLVPTDETRRAQAEAAIEGLRAFAQKHTLGGLSIRDLINEGRRY